MFSNLCRKQLQILGNLLCYVYVWRPLNCRLATAFCNQPRRRALTHPPQPRPISPLRLFSHRQFRLTNRHRSDPKASMLLFYLAFVRISFVVPRSEEQSFTRQQRECRWSSAIPTSTKDCVQRGKDFASTAFSNGARLAPDTMTAV